MRPIRHGGTVGEPSAYAQLYLEAKARTVRRA